jgi:Putative peptidoglycan binding domain
MATDHEVQLGECMTSIADQHGFFWEYLWGLPENAALREKREDPHTLAPGDIVHIPDLREKEVPVKTGRTWEFRKKGIPAQVRLQLFRGEEPRATEEYTFQVAGRRDQTGKTDGDGVLRVFIPPDAASGKLTIGPDEQVYEFDFGKLQPIETIEGVQARLNNLGYSCGEPNGELNDETRKAIGQFQRRFGLEPTGEPDEATKEKLIEVHDEENEY